MTPFEKFLVGVSISLGVVGLVMLGMIVLICVVANALGEPKASKPYDVWFNHEG